MKIAYIANIRFPTERAHGLQIAKMCEAFLLNGLDTELVIPKRSNPLLNQNPFEFYNLKNKFEIRHLSSWNLKPTKIGAILNSFSFTLKVFSYLSFNRDVIVYSREKLVILISALLGRKTFIEIHEGRHGILDFLVSKIATGAIFISQGLFNFYKEIWLQKKTLIAPDGFDELEYENLPEKTTIRKSFDWPEDKKIIVYTGHLYDWKGADLLAKVSVNLPDFLFIFVGGTENEIKNYQKNFKNKNIVFVGFKPHHEIPKYLKLADLLVLPNSGKEKISSHFTSPLKLFEYMASGTPILSSDLPSLREILDEKNAYFFQADNLESLQTELVKILKDENRDKKAKLAQLQVEKYTWNNRAKNILNFIQNA